MAKAKSFAQKMDKSTLVIRKCETCGDPFSTVKVVATEQKESESAWRFKEKIVLVCKCNEKEVYS